MPLRLGLLALLDLADRDGDELTAALEDWLGATRPLEAGQVHETLSQLARDGLVASTRRGTTYAITRSGRDALAEWFAADTAGAVSPREDLLVKVLLALPGGRERALDVITRQRGSLTVNLHARRQAVRAATSNTRLDRDAEVDAGNGDGLKALAPVLVEDAKFALAEAELRWLDLCEARLETGLDGPFRVPGRVPEHQIQYTEQRQAGGSAPAAPRS